MSELLNISVIDGRYKQKVKDFENYFSEYALIKYRLFIELSWLKFIVEEKIIDEKLSADEIKKIDCIFNDFNINEALRIKEIESKTKHDVKSIEYYIQEKFKEINLGRLIPFIHITLTSEDINNTSYNLMINEALNNVYFDNVNELITKIDKLSDEYKTVDTSPVDANSNSKIIFMIDSISKPNDIESNNYKEKAKVSIWDKIKGLFK